MQQETSLKLRVITRLKKLPNTWFVKIQQTSINGTPDILACVCGIFVAIELKTDKGTLSALQEYNLDKIGKCGGLAFVMTPSNMEDIFLYLESFAKAGAKFVKNNRVIS